MMRAQFGSQFTSLTVRSRRRCRCPAAGPARVRFVALAVIIASGLAATSGTAQQDSALHRPLPITDALAMARLNTGSPLSLSRDGRWVAYTLTHVARGIPERDPRYKWFGRTGVAVPFQNSEVWVAAALAGRSEPVLSNAGSASWAPSWAPDGRQLAFLSNRSGAVRLWLWNHTSRHLRRLAAVAVRSDAFDPPHWSADGSKLLVKLWPEGVLPYQVLEQAPPPPALTDGGGATAPGATVSVFYSGAGAPAGGESKGSEAVDARHGGTNYLLSDLGLIDIATGRVDRLARRVKTDWYALSPDGRRLAYTIKKQIFKGGDAWDLDYRVDLVTQSLTDRKPRVIAAEVPAHTGRAVSWSPDGQWLAYTTAGAQTQVYVVRADGSAPPRDVSAGVHAAIRGDWRPLWDASSHAIYLGTSIGVWETSVPAGIAREVGRVSQHTIVGILSTSGRADRFWSPDGGHSLVVMTRDSATSQSGFFDIDLATGAAARSLEDGRSYGSLLYGCLECLAAGSADGERLVYQAENPQESAELWSVDASFRSPRRVTNLNPQLRRIAMGASRLVEWQSTDGHRLRGALLLPSNYVSGLRYPLVVFQYPGERMSELVANKYGLGRTGGDAVENWQLLATRGYAVLLPDIPDLPDPSRTRMETIAAAVLPGVDKVIELGIADPERLGVIGHSYGGYGVLSLLVQTTRFKAAVSRNGGMLDRFVQYGQLTHDGASYYVDANEIQLGGTPWERRDWYIETSPFFYLDRVRTPLLLIQGTADETVGPAQADQMFAGLRRLGQEVAYAKYEGEDHSEGDWRYANQLDYLTRMIAWFDRHLKPRPETSAER